MKLSEALDIMNPKRIGYVIYFEQRKNNMLHSDYFPDVLAGERGIETLDGARALAEKFADATSDDIVNIYVCRADDFTPAGGHETLKKY